MVVACLYISWKRQEGLLDIEGGKDMVKADGWGKKFSRYVNVRVWGGGGVGG